MDIFCNFKTIIPGHKLRSKVMQLSATKSTTIGSALAVCGLTTHRTQTTNLSGSTSLIMRTPLIKRLPESDDDEWNVYPGKFGRFGGKFVPETLMTSLGQLEAEFNFVLKDPKFQVCNLDEFLRVLIKRKVP